MRYSYQEVFDLYNQHPDVVLDILLDAVRQIPDGGLALACGLCGCRQPWILK